MALLRGQPARGGGTVSGSYALIPSPFREDATPGRYWESIRVGGRLNPQGILKDLLELPFRDEVRHGRDIR